MIDKTVRSVRFAVFCAVSLCTSQHVQAERLCPRGIEPISYKSLGQSQIGVEVTINGREPFEFMLDTGAQITVLNPAISNQLDLRPRGSVGIVSVVRHAQTGLVNVESMELGRYGVMPFTGSRQRLIGLDQLLPT